MAELREVRFVVPGRFEEAVSNLLFENGAEGVEVRDSATLRSTPEDSVEVVVWAEERLQIEDYVNRVERLMASLAVVENEGPVWSWQSDTIASEDWKEKYKAYFRITRLGRRFVIKPSWEAYKPGEDDIVVELDPGGAFGTAQHASTRLVLSALERIEAWDPMPQWVLDMGCGSGILSIAAAKLWPECHVVAVDHDGVAVDTTRENIERNGVSDRVRVQQGTADKVEGRFDLVLANLQYDLLVGLKPRLFKLLADSHGTLVASGLLAEQAAELSLRYCTDMIFEPEYSEESPDGWRCFLFRTRVAA